MNTSKLKMMGFWKIIDLFALPWGARVFSGEPAVPSSGGWLPSSQESPRFRFLKKRQQEAHVEKIKFLLLGIHEKCLGKNLPKQTRFGMTFL